MRLAAAADVPALRDLIAVSAVGLGTRDYSPEQVRAALQGVFGVDSQLIDDRTYFVAEIDGVLAGCGGWSKRATRFGSDAHGERDAALLDPARDGARIRAFFVHPDHERRGVARALLERCEREAQAAGFQRIELTATLTGVGFYAAHGYAPDAPIEQPLPSGDTLRLVPMRKDLG